MDKRFYNPNSYVMLYDYMIVAQWITDNTFTVITSSYAHVATMHKSKGCSYFVASKAVIYKTNFVPAIH